MNKVSACDVTSYMLSYGLLSALVIAQVPSASLRGYAEILKSNVKNGLVDYRRIEKNDLSKLDDFITAVGKAKLPSQKNERIGFYVDAYNAFVLRAVIRLKHPKSVLDVKDFFDKENYLIAGLHVSLNQLEKKMLNPYAKDPRTHMVLVCAAMGCPVLDNKPYSGSDINERFNTATRRYLASENGARVEAGVLQLSQIFKWYIDDFGGPSGRRKFLEKYLPGGLREKAGANETILFFDYDWQLNKQ
ncbi:MAG: DUF547 domain-containing protein [Myxococcota bacterium]|nr:DUF547 domain-containing protein [Myxococcota bacterium]